MVFTINLKWLSFKQNLSDMAALIENEKATYVVMRYAQDIPQRIYCDVMDYLVVMKEALLYDKLVSLVTQYENASGIEMVMDEELDSSINLEFNDNEQLIRVTETDKDGNIIKQIDKDIAECQKVGLILDDDEDDIIYIGG